MRGWPRSRGGPAVRNADRQDRAVLHHHGGPRARSAAGLRPAEPRAPARGRDEAISADPRHRRSREELPPLALPRSGLGDQGLARPAAHHASRTARALGLDDGAWVRLEVARGKGAAACASSSPIRRRSTSSTPGWAGGCRRIPRPSTARSTSTSMPRSPTTALGPRLRLLRRARPALPRRADRGEVTSRPVGPSRGCKAHRLQRAQRRELSVNQRQFSFPSGANSVLYIASAVS